MPKKHYLTIAAAALLSLSGLSSAFAGTETAAPADKTVATPCPVTYITGDFGVTFVSEYVSRGLVFQDKGVIGQPYLDIYIALYSGSGFISSVSAQLSFWADIGSNTNSVQSALGVPLGAANGHATKFSTVPSWYEFDWDPGLSVTFAKNFTLLVQYFEFDSPSGSFGTARSIDANLTYNDSGLLGAFALHPHFTVLYELGAPGFAGIKSHGWYYEVGIAPSYTFLPKSTYPITVALPTTVGLGDDHGFYAGNTFGYLAAGPSISVPLAFIPSGFGSWTVTAAYTYYLEGTTVRAANNGYGTNDSNSRNVVSGAIGCTF